MQQKWYTKEFLFCIGPVSITLLCVIFYSCTWRWIINRHLNAYLSALCTQFMRREQFLSNRHKILLKTLKFQGAGINLDYLKEQVNKHTYMVGDKYIGKLDWKSLLTLIAEFVNRNVCELWESDSSSECHDQ